MVSQQTTNSTEYQYLEIHPPTVLDLSQDTEYASQAALWGIEVSTSFMLFVTSLRMC